MTQLNVALLVIGGAVLFLGLFSGTAKRWGLPDPLVMLLVGVGIGPLGLNLLKAEEWDHAKLILEEAARLALAVGLMGVALRIPRGFLRRNWRPLAVVLIGAMLFMWLSSSLLIGLIVGLPLWTALLAGAIVTPTDPVVASVIVTGEVAEKNLPDRLRRFLSSESGFNDGLAYPFALLPILMLTKPQGEAVSHWLTRVILWDVAAAVVAGVAIGYTAGRLLRWAERRKMIEGPSILAYTVALALFTLAAVKLMGSDGILAVFVAGLGFDHVVDASERTNEERVVEGIDRFFTLPVFGLLGLLIPWDQWRELGWRAALVVVAVLLLRRLPLFAILTGRLRPLPRTADSLFLGWFGPIGVAAMFYVTLAHRRTHEEATWTVATLLICASVAVHGLTSTPFTRWYGKTASHAEDQDG